jgi:2-polyprenyl-6-methoxyphenol hydroxylase-like FAD-dependent oxidoreductase
MRAIDSHGGSMETDVLIVGAGPTGLMLANQLARRGIKPLIIDRREGPSLETKAIGVQARTLEIYSQLGIAERALKLGKPGTGGNIWARGKRRARVALTDAGANLTPYPFLLVLGQDDNERIMGELLRDFGVSVHWNSELVRVVQNPDSVTATLKKADGTESTVRAAWVAGCDGAHSVVREACGIEFSGAPYEHVFFVADLEMTGTMIPDEVNVYLFRDGFHLLFPMRGQNHWRVAGILPPALRHKPDLKFEEVIPSLHNEASEDFAIRLCSWFSTYRIHHRKAVRFRDGRCFLLGDAAHVHSPVGAQGMNTGLQDAYNLGWKLALVVKGHANESLLNSYEEERVPVAKALLNGTDRAFRLVVSDNWFAGMLRSKVLATIAAFIVNRKAMQRIAFRTISQTGIQYRRSSVSRAVNGLPETAPQAGDRFPWLKLKFSADGVVEDLFQKLSDLQFNLLIFGQPDSPQDIGIQSDLLRVHIVPRDSSNARELSRAQIPQPSFFLVRPDGYIGFCGTRLQASAVRNYLSRNLYLGSKPRPRTASADQ